MFSGAKKHTQSHEIVVAKIQQIMFLTFSSYSINILPNYLIFLTGKLSHLYNIQTQKPLNIQCFWFSLLNQVCFRIYMEQ